jgi:alpha-1,4-digalacturonate transport system permease protein
MQRAITFLTRTKGRGGKLDIADMLTYTYLFIGTMVMFGPVFWLVISSFKTQEELQRFPPRLLPHQAETVEVEGLQGERALFDVTLTDATNLVVGDMRVRLRDLTAQTFEFDFPDDSTVSITDGQTVMFEPDEDAGAAYRLVLDDGTELPLNAESEIDLTTLEAPSDEVRITNDTSSVTWQRGANLTVDVPDVEPYTLVLDPALTLRLAQGVGLNLINPERPGVSFDVPLNRRDAIERVEFTLDNYVEGVESFAFIRYFANSVFVTTTATILTLIVNSMAAFALSKYEFPGRNAIFVLIISTLMVPLSVILVPVYLLIVSLGWNNQLIGVIIPTIATPTGVFLLRQYMLTIPDELIESARIDGASEWRIYLQIILPLAGPALAVLAIFSVMWRWNDFLWPKIVLTRSEVFTLQVGLESFQGDLTIQPHLILAMTVLTLLPITLVFGILQRYITTGIATTGMK